MELHRYKIDGKEIAKVEQQNDFPYFGCHCRRVYGVENMANEEKYEI
jgi:hypothetical protein